MTKRETSIVVMVWLDTAAVELSGKCDYLRE